jgi:DNA-binding CsgD family transcriptional regulator
MALPSGGWPGLFAAAFRQSKNGMVLVDEDRTIVDVNGSMLALLGHTRAALVGHRMWEFVAGGPLATPAEWAGLLEQDRFTGEAALLCADDGIASVQWGASTETITGRRLVLFVALSTSRWGRHFRPHGEPSREPAALSDRQREIVQLVALGLSGPEIADELQIAHETVRTHVRTAKERLGARSRAHLVAKALGEGHV